MTRYDGEARLKDLDGVVLAERLHAWIDDEPEGAPSYVHNRGAYGEIWLDDGDLMSGLRPDARCRLTLDSDRAIRVRVNSFDRGGARAQFVEDGPLG